jgi:hypothetical protein
MQSFYQQELETVESLQSLASRPVTHSTGSDQVSVAHWEVCGGWGWGWGGGRCISDWCQSHTGWTPKAEVTVLACAISILER